VRFLVLVWARWSRTPWRDIGYVRPRSWIRTLALGIVFGSAFKLLMKAIESDVAHLIFKIIVERADHSIMRWSSQMQNASRKGFHSITPRIVVADAAAQVAFLRTVFDAAGEHHAERPAEMRIGDSLVMVTPAGAREPFPAFLYVYVDNADAIYRRALAAGAVSLEEPLNTPYGDRRAMVRDPFGNVWQIAHVISAS